MKRACREACLRELREGRPCAKRKTPAKVRRERGSCTEDLRRKEEGSCEEDRREENAEEDTVRNSRSKSAKRLSCRRKVCQRTCEEIPSRKGSKMRREETPAESGSEEVHSLNSDDKRAGRTAGANKNRIVDRVESTGCLNGRPISRSAA
jgi:hypothetical protein